MNKADIKLIYMPEDVTDFSSEAAAMEASKRTLAAEEIKINIAALKEKPPEHLTPKEKKILRKEYENQLKELISEGLTPESWHDYSSRIGNRSDLVKMLKVIGCKKFTHEFLWGGGGRRPFTMRFSYCSRECPHNAYITDSESYEWDDWAGSPNYDKHFKTQLFSSERCSKYGHTVYIDFSARKRRPINMKKVKPRR